MTPCEERGWGYVRYVGDVYRDITRGKVYEVFFTEDDRSYFDMVDDTGDSFCRAVGDEFVEVTQKEYLEQNPPTQIQYKQPQQIVPQKSGVLYNGILYETSNPDEMIEIANAIHTLNEWPQSTI